MEGKGISGGVAEVKEKFLTVYMVGENSLKFGEFDVVLGATFQ